MACSNPIEFEVDEEEANGFFEGDCQDSPFEYDEDSESDEEGSESDDADGEDTEAESQENENDEDEEEYEFGLGAYMFEPRRRPGAEGERPPIGDDRNRLETTDWYVLAFIS